MPASRKSPMTGKPTEAVVILNCVAGMCMFDYPLHSQTLRQVTSQGHGVTRHSPRTWGHHAKREHHHTLTEAITHRIHAIE